MNAKTALKKVRNFNSAHAIHERFADPLRKSFSLKIKRYYTNTAGAIIDKSLVPAALQTKFPVYLFGEFDESGGYPLGNYNVPPKPSTFFVYKSTFGSGFDFVQFSGINNLVQNFRIGDFILLYADDPLNPNIFIWIQISGDLQPYSSILRNPLTSGINVFEVKLFADNQLQYFEDWNLLVSDEIGNIVSIDKLAPMMYKDAEQINDEFIPVKLDFLLNNWFGLYFYMNFNTDLISLEFNYRKTW